MFLLILLVEAWWKLTISSYKKKVLSSLRITFTRANQLKRPPIMLQHTLCTSELQTIIISYSCWAQCRCDNTYVDGTSKPKDVQHGSFSHAEKIHAMARYGFKKILRTGEVPWHQIEGSNGLTGQWVGNPAISEIVSTYMVSLHWRKVSYSQQYNFNFKHQLRWIALNSGPARRNTTEFESYKTSMSTIATQTSSCI